MHLYSGTSLARKRIMIVCMAVLMLTATASAGGASTTSPTSPTSPAANDDGQHDFDWELGKWRSDVRVLADPLSGSADEWLRFEGTTVVRPLMGRRANVVEFDVTGTAGRIEALNLRLFEPQADRWSLTFVNLRDGLLTPAVYGGFRDGVGEFYGEDRLNGRPILVRFLITRQGPDRARFEQAYSADDGATWETNWIAIDRRIQ
jgi:hypothetical protein